jgi:hypothetical protein
VVNQEAICKRGGIGGELARLLKYVSDSTQSGAIAQLGERIVRNDEVVGSIPTSSTISFNSLRNDFEIGFQLLTFLLDQ